MEHKKSRHIPKPGNHGRFLGVSLFVLAIATGSVAVYECSPDSRIPILPSDNSPQPQDPNPAPSTNPVQTPPDDPPQQPPTNPPQTPPSDPPQQPPQSPDRNDLSSMRTTTLQVGTMAIYAWIAETQLQRQYGLMWVQPSELADNQGMLFVFEENHMGGFWMKDTLIPLDIAFIRDDGMVVDIQQMPPQSLEIHGPSVPYQYALEVNAGVLNQAGLQPGHVIQIPPNVLNR